ncbi:MAG: HAD-IIIA family hydrolase [Anaerolineae bacterium]|nr:HAD-IIIA family hydrolase [Anaerolineae bacterium]
MSKAIIFDWGDTVMRNFTEYPGPMANWPRVETMPGIEQALQALHPHYRLVMATNAADSGRDLVLAALRRVALDGHFDAVYTARELGARKPEPAFYQAMLQALGCPPHEATMVGDDYRVDVCGAKQAGLRAIWYNPAASPCPDVHPLHDAEVQALASLPATLAGRPLPDMGECLQLLAGQEVPPNAIAHCRAVAGVAHDLACRLRARGHAVDPLLAHRGGLLHDLDKASSRLAGEEHGCLAARLLRNAGQPALAEIVERHLMFSILNPAEQPATWEQKLVYYVDKIIEQSVISLQERLESLCRRYPENAERMRECLPAILRLEAEICGALSMSATELQEMETTVAGRALAC